MGGCLKSNNSSEQDNKKKQMFSDVNEEILRVENEMYKEIDQYFHEFDTNNNMFLDANELMSCFDTVIKRKEEEPELKNKLIEFKNQVILTKNKLISKEQFRNIMSCILLENFTMNEMIEMFRIFDKKKDAKICENEIIHIFNNLGVSIDQEVAKELIKEASYNGNNYIDFEEFARVMMSK